MEADMQALAVAIVSSPMTRQAAAAGKHYSGDGRDILLQGFHWPAHAGAQERGGPRKSWYRIIRENAATIKAAGFTWVWFPPASDSLAPQGYIPRRWNVLNTAFGTESELEAAIQAIKPVRAMADLVLNHRVGVATSGADFEDPQFADNRAAITRDDESGVGTGNRDAGEKYATGGRHLDHTNPDVRSAVKDYLRRLQAVGFQGWRYDLVKGFHGKFVGEYNDATAPKFSVGEFFDGDRQKVTNWIDGTGGRSGAFDFPTRFLLFEACATDDYGRLRSVSGGRVVPAGLMGYWPSCSVTFLDNHDTEHRREEEHRRSNDGIHHFPGKTVAMGYAYLLTHPGVPCVYWPHYFDWDDYTRQRIERLIQVRTGMAIHARSRVDIYEARPGLYAAGIDGKVAVKLGTQPWSPGVGWQLALDGDRFAVWTRGQ
jgi:alpha-amylase